MRYETPELMALTPAINAIQEFKYSPISENDGPVDNEHTTPGYADWE